MSWFADLAGKAETLLNNLDEQTGAVLGNNGGVVKPRRHDPVPFPEPSLGQRRRPIPKYLKRNSMETKSNLSPTRKLSPTNHQPRSSIKGSLDNVRVNQERRKRSPPKKLPQYSLHNCPKTLVNDFDNFGLKQRRFSLPTDLEIINNENLTYDMQTLEVENAMLKNELNVMNREVSDLMERLRKTEDELIKTQAALEASEKVNHRLSLDKEGLLVQLEDVRNKIEEVSVVEISQYRTQKQEMEAEIQKLNMRNNDLENMISNLTQELNNNTSIQNRLDNDLRHAQSQISELESDLEKRNQECERIEKEWESYKLRVKNMLVSKDGEIKSLREGKNMTEETKHLIEQIDALKEERDDLTQNISRVKTECSEIKQQMSLLESRHTNAERVVVALRDALKEERAARNKAEAQANGLGKELQAVQLQSNQTIANLRSALHKKDEEINNLKEISSQTSDSSALNVGDYDVMHSIDNEKIQYLTQTLIQKQGKIDSLLADNNILKVQLNKLDSKYKNEIASLRANSHSVIHLNDDTRRARNYAPSSLSKLSVRIGVMIKRYPIFRLFIFFYMIGLHFWVLTVLLTSTPENYIRPTKS
ncbi:golgin subfamily A member 5-like [Colias croceus]|uniref:golgin subfamily A member 5-like n=1 Tax=Colias crocea TaxID=72248 RepID=UPI001E27C2AC|nr:golgin subfamily A member 5-like [Colias croceus]